MAFFTALYALFDMGLILKSQPYNVENLFDLVHDGHEYEEYIP